MTVAASGPLSVVLDAARTVLSGVAAFQDRLSVSTAAEALPRIYYYQIHDDPLESLPRPFAVLALPSWSYPSPATDTFTGSGTLRLLLSDEPRFDQENDAFIDFCNFAGDVMDDLVDASGLPVKFVDHMLHINLVEPPNRTRRRSRDAGENDYYRIVFDINYGEGGE